MTGGSWSQACGQVQRGVTSDCHLGVDTRLRAAYAAFMSNESYSDDASTSTRRESEGDSCEALCLHEDAIRRARSSAVQAALVERTTAIFSALADPTRFRILEALSHEEMCVCDLTALCEVSQSGVSHQLRMLRDRGLVAYRRDANRAVYRLADDHVRDMLAIGLAHAEESAEAR